MSEMREQFENWVSAPPREFDVERFDEDHDIWPGCYITYKVQCAWEAWQAAQEDGLVADLRRHLAEAQTALQAIAAAGQKFDAKGTHSKWVVETAKAAIASTGKQEGRVERWKNLEAENAYLRRQLDEAQKESKDE